MREEIGIVAIGQAAGNIGLLFEEKGYNVFYINTSTEDLNTLKDSAHKYHVPGGEGCAKERDKAKTLLAMDIDNLIDGVRTKIPQKQVLVIFSSGGGTGSGLSPYLMSVLVEEFAIPEEESDNPAAEPEKYFAAVTILPGKTDSTQAFMNSYECCKELLDVEDMGSVFFLDNDSQNDKLTINRVFVDALDAVFLIPDKHKSAKGNVDRAEVKKALFKTPGAAVVCKLSRERNTEGQIIASLKNSVFAPIENDRAVLYYLTSTTRELNKASLYAELGEPLDMFATYNEGSNIMLVSGLTYPNRRLDQIYGVVEAKSHSIEKSYQATANNKLSKDTNILAKARAARQSKSVMVKDPAHPSREVAVAAPPKKSGRDLLKKYSR